MMMWLMKEENSSGSQLFEPKLWLVHCLRRTYVLSLFCTRATAIYVLSIFQLGAFFWQVFACHLSEISWGFVKNQLGFHEWQEQLQRPGHPIMCSVHVVGAWSAHWITQRRYRKTGFSSRKSEIAENFVFRDEFVFSHIFSFSSHF